MRRVSAFLGAIVLLSTSVTAVTAGPAVKETDHVRDAGCGFVAVPLGNAEFYASVSDVNGTDGYLNVFAGDPYASDLVFTRDYDRPVSATFGVGTVSMDIPVLPSGDATFVGTLTAMDAINYDDHFKDGNQTFRVTGIGTAFSLTGSLTLPGASPATVGPENCSGSDVTTTTFFTQPHAAVRSFSSTSGFCELQNADGDTAGVFFFEDNGSLGIDATITDVGGAQIEAFGSGTLDSAGHGSFTLDEFDPSTFTSTGGLSTVSISVVDTGETFDYTIRLSNAFQRVKASLLDVSGSLATSLGAFDLDPCIIAARQSKLVIAASSGPKAGGKRPANDLPSGAISVKSGYKGTVATKGAQLPSEAAYPCLTFDDGAGGSFSVPVEYTVWYKVTGTGSPMTVDTAGSDYDTVVGVYTGTPGAFSNVACNDDVGLVPFGHTTQAAATFDTVAGTTYWIQAGGLDEGLSFSLPYGTLRVAIR